MLHDAFWKLLEQRPYGSVNVRDVARVAGVNKNTFYYHYHHLDELAADAIAEALPYEFSAAVLKRLLVFDEVTSPDHIPSLPSEGISNAMKAISKHSAVSSEEFSQKLARLQLLAGPHGSPALQVLLKDTMVNAWCELLGLDRTQFGDESLLAVDFLYGGILGILMHCAANERTNTNGVRANTLTETGFYQRLTAAVPPVIFGTLAADGVALPQLLASLHSGSAISSNTPQERPQLSSREI